MLFALFSTHIALAQFPRTESFQNSTAPNFTLGGSAVLTAANNGPDANGAGYLRLTSNASNQAGFAVDNTTFNAPQGFSISFEFFSYGGTGADGISVFLFDGATPTFRIGATGGSLGYAQKTSDPIADGVSNGYIGIGLDEFGNFSSPTEGRVDGPGVRADAVAIRGAGNGRSATDYPYLTGTGTLPFGIDVSTARAQPGSANYRRAFIDVVPVAGGTYQITVRIQNGNAVTTAVQNFQVPAPPPTLRLGFAASTGGSTNFHEIRNLAIVQAPYANDDRAGTPYNLAVTLNVLSNDLAIGASLAPGSVDLDPNTAGQQTTFAVTDQGTFTVNNQGVVTFTPSGSFAGVVTIPYTVSSILGDVSNPANITVVVRGADVATSINGPASTNPGTRVSYTVTTANVGVEPATFVVPTLQLPTNLSNVTVSSGSYNPNTGLVSFGTIPTLTSGSQAVVNTASFSAPISGPISAVASFTATSVDPVSSNNTASLTTAINGPSNIAASCAFPGVDGPATISGSNSVATSRNTYYPGTASTTGGGSTIQVGAAGFGSTALKAGDLILVIQMQGATLNTENNGNYGLTSTGYSAGLYEYAVVSSVSSGFSVGAGGTITVAKPLLNAYERANFVQGTNSGQRRFQVLHVPQYSSLNLNGTISGPGWNGETGGVIALEAAGNTSFTNGTIVDMNGRGFRGGAGRQYTGAAGYSNQDVRNLASTTAAGAHGSKGEGSAGTPRYVYNGTTSINTNSEGYAFGSVAAGAAANGGGGATDYAPDNNSGNAGGGGGGNGGGGGRGGYAVGTPDFRALGGTTNFGGIDSRLFMGGGGGAGSANIAGAEASSGAPGGGIIILRTGTITGNGTLRANGTSATDRNSEVEGAGGGGAGGSVVVIATPPAGQSAGLGNLTVIANGGDGGNGRFGNNNTTLSGPGGGGGGGFIFANGMLSSSSAAAGTNGVTGAGNGNNTPNSYGASAGAAGIVTTTTNPDNTAIIGGAGACLPQFSASLSTGTPSVTRTGGPGSLVNPASYTLTLSNTGGQTNGLTAEVQLAAGIVTYRSETTPVATLVLANGTTTALTNFTTPANGASTGTFNFGNTVIPAGATVTITFSANIAATAVDGTAYEANALVTYLDPTRTTASSTITPGNQYAGGGVALGSNYAAASSTAEDVRIVRPLPVELVRLDVVARNNDAVISWATASELNNSHFEVERSRDGRVYEHVGRVEGHGTTSRTQAYSFTDAGAKRAGSLLYYRLRQVDNDGNSKLSQSKTVRFGGAVKSSDLSLYPNPTTGDVTIDLTTLGAGTQTVTITDLAGRHVGTYQLMGGQLHVLSLRQLPAGTYLVSAATTTSKVVQKLTKH